MRRENEVQSIVPLRQQDALGMTLPRQSRFTAYQLAGQVAEYPDLAFRTIDSGDYAVGGFWRRRTEIGTILEISAGNTLSELFERLVIAYRERQTNLVLLDLREQTRRLDFYRHNGFAPIETLIQLERHGLKLKNEPPTMPIRDMEERDLGPVLDVERHSFPFIWWNSESELRWYATVNGVHLYVATDSERADRVVGYVGFTVFEKQAHLDRLAVHSDYMGRGYGAALLSFAMRKMAALGARRVALTTQRDNHRSQGLYKRFGFRDSGWQHDIYGLVLRLA